MLSYKSAVVFLFSVASAGVLVSPCGGGDTQYKLDVIDTGTATTCGAHDCCIPSCTVDLFGFSCKGSVGWGSNCQYNYDFPKEQEQSIDGDGCDGWKMYWHPKTSNGVGVITVNLPDESTYAFELSDCKTPSEGGQQCVPTGGGCKTCILN